MTFPKTWILSRGISNILTDDQSRKAQKTTQKTSYRLQCSEHKLRPSYRGEQRNKTVARATNLYCSQTLFERDTWGWRNAAIFLPVFISPLAALLCRGLFNLISNTGYHIVATRTCDLAINHLGTPASFPAPHLLYRYPLLPVNSVTGKAAINPSLSIAVHTGGNIASDPSPSPGHGCDSIAVSPHFPLFVALGRSLYVSAHLIFLIVLLLQNPARSVLLVLHLHLYSAISERV